MNSVSVAQLNDLILLFSFACGHILVPHVDWWLHGGRSIQICFHMATNCDFMANSPFISAIFVSQNVGHWPPMTCDVSWGWGSILPGFGFGFGFGFRFGIRIDIGEHRRRSLQGQ